MASVTQSGRHSGDGRSWKKLEEDGRRWKKMEEDGRRCWENKSKKQIEKNIFLKSCWGWSGDLNGGTKGSKHN